MKFLLGLALFGVGYAVAYYGANILIDAYLRTGTMNPAPLSVLLGLPGAPASASTPQAGAQQGAAPSLNVSPTLTGGAGA